MTNSGALCPILGLRDADDPRYATNAARVQNRDTLIPKLQEVFLTKTYEEWEPLLAQGILMGAINTLIRWSITRRCRRGGCSERSIPAGKVKLVGVPVKLSETPGSVRAGAAAGATYGQCSTSTSG